MKIKDKEYFIPYHEVEETKQKTMKIKELKIEVTKPVEWTKPYNEIEIPEGWRLLPVPKLWWILDKSKYMDEFLGKFKGELNIFACAQTKNDKERGYSRWLYLDRSLGLISGRYRLDYSNSNGRVVFARELGVKFFDKFPTTESYILYKNNLTEEDLK